MTPTQAAAQWLEAERAIRAVTEQHAKLRDDAAKVLKAHFAKTGKPTFRGIGYACSTYDSLDTALARQALGPTKTAACTVTRSRESLSDLTRKAPVAAST